MSGGGCNLRVSGDCRWAMSPGKKTGTTIDRKENLK